MTSWGEWPWSRDEHKQQTEDIPTPQTANRKDEAHMGGRHHLDGVAPATGQLVLALQQGRLALASEHTVRPNVPS